MILNLYILTVAMQVSVWYSTLKTMSGLLVWVEAWVCDSHWTGIAMMVVTDVNLFRLNNNTRLSRTSVDGTVDSTQLQLLHKQAILQDLVWKLLSAYAWYTLFILFYVDV